LKRTPLYEAHKARGATLIDFGGWEMPVQYTSIIDEHLATREKAGLFDVSHMGEITVKGPGAKAALNKLITGNMDSVRQFKTMYTLLTNDKGGVVDDLLVYIAADDDYFLVVNASNTDKDYAWLKERVAAIDPGVEVKNVSADYGQIAIQGPLAQDILQKITDCDLTGIEFFSFAYAGLRGNDGSVIDSKAIISRTGYTGEDGFEIYCDAGRAYDVWELLLKIGADEGLVPVGLGARDTLRFESALPLYGHELGEDITPIEAGLKFFVKFDKDDYPGKSVLQAQVDGGAARRLVGIEMVERGIPREGYRIEADGEDIGYVTSGTFSPTLKKGLAMALISAKRAKTDTLLDVVIRDKRVQAKVIRLPFYKKRTKTEKNK